VRSTGQMSPPLPLLVPLPVLLPVLLPLPLPLPLLVLVDSAPTTRAAGCSRYVPHPAPS
jgi:hypothetical protein